MHLSELNRTGDTTGAFRTGGAIGVAEYHLIAENIELNGVVTSSNNDVGGFAGSASDTNAYNIDV